MKISILCSVVEHPVYPAIASWRSRYGQKHEIEIVQEKAKLNGGDLLFLISCHEIIGRDIRDMYRATLVIHASNLPDGRGWSPHIWQILSGRNEIPVALLEVEDRVDSGAIWTQRALRLEGHELYDEINSKLFAVELELMDFAIAQWPTIVPQPQEVRDGSYYERRTPEDSRLDPTKTISEQFDLLRVADPQRYPAFFDYRGQRYIDKLEKTESNTDE
jgi:methionyl-tRNA formyltransferase